MPTLLYHETATTGSMVATPDKAGRISLPARRYYHQGPFLLVDGPDEDVEEILKIAGYRLATASEQNEFAALQKKAGQLTEASEPVAKPVKSGEATPPAQAQAKE